MAKTGTCWRAGRWPIPMDSGSRITAVENGPADTTFLFTVREIETDGFDLSSESDVEF